VTLEPGRHGRNGFSEELIPQIDVTL